MADWKIKGKYGSRAAETVDTAKTLRDAQYLAGEYAMSFGPGWTIWIEEPKTRGKRAGTWHMNPLPEAGAPVRFYDRNLGVRLHQWHYGQDDPIYATGSLIYAGQPVPRDLLVETIDALQTLRRRTKSRTDKSELKDLVVLLIAAGF